MKKNCTAIISICDKARTFYYRTLAMVRPQKINRFWIDIIQKSVKSCLQEFSTACLDCQLPSRRRRRKSNFHHFCQVNVFEWVASAQEDPIFSDRVQNSEAITKRGEWLWASDSVRPDVTQIVWTQYLTRKWFDKILDDCSTFSIFRWAY